MSLEIVKASYQGIEINFTEDGWFNATAAADKFSKKPIDWLKLKETKIYIDRLCVFHKVRENHFVKTIRGTKSPGTWFHPRLAIPFARWCDTDFSIWCDAQIDGIIRGKHPHYDWKRMRHEASSSFKVMNAVIQLQRQTIGKETKFFHYANEAKLINWALTGEFKPLDREGLSYEELGLLAKLEERNTVLIGCGLDRDTRKLALVKFVENSRTPKAISAADTFLIERAA